MTTNILSAFASELRVVEPSQLLTRLSSQNRTALVHTDFNYGEFIFRFANDRGYAIVENSVFEHRPLLGFEVSWVGPNGRLTSGTSTPFLVGHESRRRTGDAWGMVYDSPNLNTHFFTMDKIKDSPRITAEVVEQSGLFIPGRGFFSFAERLEFHASWSTSWMMTKTLSMQDWIYQ